jgi:hypothetical protein
MPTPPTPLVGDTGLTAPQIREYNNRLDLARTPAQQAQVVAWKEQLVQHNDTVQRQYQNDVRQMQQQAQTRQDTLAHQAQTAQLSQQAGERDAERLQLARDANTRANQEAADKARVAGETYVPGTGIEAVHENTLQKYAAKMAKGQPLTDDEQRLYDGAYYALQQAGGQTGVMDDPNNSGVKIPYQTTRRLAPSLPEPRGGALPTVISQPGAPTKAPTTLEQARATTFAGRMQVATPVMDELDDITTYSQRGLEKAGKYVGYNLNSPEYRRLRVAQEAFLSGVIRQDSGAAVDKSEWERYAHLYFPMPGEDVQTLKLKQRIRQAEMESMVRAAGPNYKPVAQEPDKAPAAKPADKKPANRPPLSSFEG